MEGKISEGEFEEEVNNLLKNSKKLKLFTDNHCTKS